MNQILRTDKTVFCNLAKLKYVLYVPIERGRHSIYFVAVRQLVVKSPHLFEKR